MSNLCKGKLFDYQFSRKDAKTQGGKGRGGDWERGRGENRKMRICVDLSVSVVPIIEHECKRILTKDAKETRRQGDKVRRGTSVLICGSNY